MQIHKIHQYSIPSLLKILLYRILYDCLLSFRIISFKHRKYKTIDCFNTVAVKKKYSEYFKRVHIDDNIIDKSDRILKGNIYLFEMWYGFDFSKDWLRDPISRNFWNKQVYCYNAPFVEDNHADVKYTLEANKLNSLVTVAQAYYITKNEKYIHFIKNSLTSWIKCVPVESSVVNRIVMDLAYRAINLIHISLLCFDNTYFYQQVYPVILGILRHHEKFMWDRLGCRWFKSNNENNHTIGELVGLYVNQLWLNSFIGKDYTKKQNKELKYLIATLDKTIAPSGAYIEQSGNYTKVVAEFIDLLDLFLTINNDKFCHVFYEKNYKGRLLEYLSRITYNDTIDNFGDNDGAAVLIPFEKNIYSIDHLCNSTSTLKNSDYSDASQWVYNSSDGKKIHIFIRVGKHAYYVEGSYIHAHNDNLSIILGMYGSRIFIDKGCYLYNSGVDVRNEYTSLFSHNSIYFEGIDSSQIMTTGFKNYPSCNLISSMMDSNIALFTGLLKYRGVLHERSVKYLDGVIQIEDKILKWPNDRSECIMSFLLSPNIDVRLLTNDSLLLMDILNNNHFEISFKGIDSLDIGKENYYPSYGVVDTTQKIKAKIKNNKKNIITIIRKVQ